jgi:hypothetical protein
MEIFESPFFFSPPLLPPQIFLVHQEIWWFEKLEGFFIGRADTICAGVLPPKRFGVEVISTTKNFLTFFYEKTSISFSRS